jgi:hypothetical protein
LLPLEEVAYERLEEPRHIRLIAGEIAEPVPAGSFVDEELIRD